MFEDTPKNSYNTWRCITISGSMVRKLLLIC